MRQHKGAHIAEAHLGAAVTPLRQIDVVAVRRHAKILENVREKELKIARQIDEIVGAIGDVLIGDSRRHNGTRAAATATILVIIVVAGRRIVGVRRGVVSMRGAAFNGFTIG